MSSAYIDPSFRGLIAFVAFLLAGLTVMFIVAVIGVVCFSIKRLIDALKNIIQKKEQKYFANKANLIKAENNILLKKLYELCALDKNDKSDTKENTKVNKEKNSTISIIESIKKCLPSNNKSNTENDLKEMIEKEPYMNRIIGVIDSLLKDEKLFNQLSKIQMNDDKENNDKETVIDFLYTKFKSIRYCITDNPEVILYKKDDSFFDSSDQEKLEGNYRDVFVKKFEKFESKYNQDYNQFKSFQYLHFKNPSINP